MLSPGVHKTELSQCLISKSLVLLFCSSLPPNPNLDVIFGLSRVQGEKPCGLVQMLLYLSAIGFSHSQCGYLQSLGIEYARASGLIVTHRRAHLWHLLFSEISSPCDKKLSFDQDEKSSWWGPDLFILFSFGDDYRGDEFSQP